MMIIHRMSCYRSRSACACLHTASPLKADKLKEVSPRHPLREEDPSAGSFTRVAAISSPLSRSSEPCGPCGMGIAADGDWLFVSAACTCTSSAAGPDGAGWSDALLPHLAMERTTSPLHIGHVRRRVVSHGVLSFPRSAFRYALEMGILLTCTRRGTHGHKGDSLLYFGHQRTLQGTRRIQPAFHDTVVL